MLKNLFLLTAFAALPLAAQCCSGCAQHVPPTQVEATPLAESPRISDKVGRAGMVASAACSPACRIPLAMRRIPPRGMTW